MEYHQIKYDIHGTVWRNMPQSILSIKLMQLGCTYIATNND